MGDSFLDLDDVFRLMRGERRPTQMRRIRQVEDIDDLEIVEFDEIKEQRSAKITAPYLSRMGAISDVKAEHVKIKRMKDLISEQKTPSRTSYKNKTKTLGSEIRNMGKADWRRTIVLMEVLGKPKGLREDF